MKTGNAMKRFLIMAVLLAAMSAASAQKLAIGDKAPDLKVKEWVEGPAKQANLPRFIEFFHPDGAGAADRLRALASLAGKYEGRMNVTLISRQAPAQLRASIGEGARPFSAAADDNGRTFAAYDVQYVPFGVLVDARGRIAWFGNPASLSPQKLDKLLK